MSAPPPPTSIANATFLKALPKYHAKDLEERPQICFAGRSNVGKSSLINLLVGQKSLAKTSSTPGRTQLVVLFEASFHRASDVIPFHLVDLPGYGYAKVPVAMRAQWRPMMESYFQNNPRLACCVFLLDIRRTPSEDDLELLEMLEEIEIPVLPVVTKVDKTPKTQRPRELKKIAEGLGLEDWRELRAVSVQERFGHQELLAELFDVLKERGGS